MIRIGTNFEISRDKYGWMLVHLRKKQRGKQVVAEETEGPNEESDENYSRRCTWHRDLGQVCKTIIDRSAGDLPEGASLLDIINAIQQAELTCAEALNSLAASSVGEVLGVKRTGEVNPDLTQGESDEHSAVAQAA